MKLRFLLTLLIMLTCGQAIAAPVTVTDVLGRQVEIDTPPQRIVIAEARQLVALSIVDPEVSKKVVGWAAIVRFGAETREAYYKLFPNLKDIPDVEQENTISAESVLALDPDLVVMSAGALERNQALVDIFADAGIPSIFIDFRSDPFANTIPSMRALGVALGHEHRAQAYIDYYQSHMQAVIDTVNNADLDRPKVFMQMQASIGNSFTAPGAGSLGAFIKAAGGHNFAADLAPTPFVTLNPEQILIADPDIYIGTGGTHFSPEQGVVTGPGVSSEIAQRSLRTMTDADVIKELRPVSNGQFHGLWHNFTNTPLNFIALEVMAKWFHPELFKDLDPKATAQEVSDAFLPVPFNGAIWATLHAQP